MIKETRVLFPHPDSPITAVIPLPIFRLRFWNKGLSYMKPTLLNAILMTSLGKI